MTTSNVLLLAQATGYLAGLVLSLVCVIPLSLHLWSFGGHCLLFTTGVFADDGNFMAVWASCGYCIYALFTGYLILIISIVQSCRLFTFLCKGMDSSFLSAFLDCILTFVLTILAFVASILVTVGFKTWCEAVMRRFPSCDEASVMEIDKADNINTLGFYMQIGTAQFGVWSTWVCCVLLTVLSVLKLCRYHEREVIRVSMARQRQKIIRHQPEESADSDIHERY